MDWDGNVESKSPVVQHIDREKQSCADAPFAKRHGRRSEEIAAIGVELIVQCRQAGKDELEECDEETAVRLFSEDRQFRPYDGIVW